MAGDHHQKNKKTFRLIASLSPDKQALLRQQMGKRLVSGHVAVAQTLRSLGVTHVYGISGTPIVETMVACAKAGLRVIGVHHQQAAVMMATAHNYSAGGMKAIALVSAGPAVANAATGILVARDNCWPVLILGGRRPLNYKEQGQFQDLDGVALFQSITKWTAVVENTASIPNSISHAIQLSLEGQPGPIYLDLPEDVLNNNIPNFEPPTIQAAQINECNVGDTKAAANLLLHSERPGLIIGKGVRWSLCDVGLKNLVEKFDIPFITSPMGRGYLPDDHPLCFNRASSFLQSGADTLLVLGARLDWTFRYGSEFAPNAKLIHVDIAQHEIGRNKETAIGIAADIGQFLNALIPQMEAASAGENNATSEAWLDSMSEQRKQFVSRLDAVCHAEGTPMTPHRMLKEIREVLPQDAICVTDGNIIMAAVQQVIPALHPASRLTAGSNGCLGTGIPFGMGAKLANPQRPVVVITGDAAFGFNAMELETAMRHNIPIVVIIANNEGPNGSLYHKNLYPVGHTERTTMFLPDIRYERIIEAFGGHSEHVEYPGQLALALQRALDSGLPACINVRVDPDAYLQKLM